jgi:hypothetical protein
MQSTWVEFSAYAPQRHAKHDFPTKSKNQTEMQKAARA